MKNVYIFPTNFIYVSHRSITKKAIISPQNERLFFVMFIVRLDLKCYMSLKEILFLEMVKIVFILPFEFRYFKINLKLHFPCRYLGISSWRGMAYFA